MFEIVKVIIPLLFEEVERSKFGSPNVFVKSENENVGSALLIVRVIVATPEEYIPLAA